MTIVFFIFGLLIGSFLNVVVYRTRVAESLWDYSKCPNCKKRISWYDNIPLISFILLGFKCRNCKTKISWQYPLVEFFTGLSFALISWKFFNLEITDSWWLTSYFLAIISILVVIFVYDSLYMEIPSLMVWIGIGLTLISNLIFDWNFQMKDSGALGYMTYSGILAAILAFVFFFSLSYFSKEKWMGMGDAYLAILLGLIVGWPKVLLAVFLAFSIGAIYGIILIMLKKKKMQSQVPFAPFLVLGTIITILFYSEIINFYSNAFYL